MHPLTPDYVAEQVLIELSRMQREREDYDFNALEDFNHEEENTDA